MSVTRFVFFLKTKMGHYALPTEPQPLPNDLFVIESLEMCLTHKRGITMTNDVCIKRFFSELNPNKSDENRFRNGSRETSSTIQIYFVRIVRILRLAAR